MIDLHVHSTVSDGSYTPAGLAVLAKESGVEAFAVTDHDSIAGTDEAAAEAAKGGAAAAAAGVKVPWYIMTSPITHQDTL